MDRYWFRRRPCARVFQLPAALHGRPKTKNPGQIALPTGRAHPLPGARGPLASCLTWLQAGRPNHHDVWRLDTQWLRLAQGRRLGLGTGDRDQHLASRTISRLFGDGPVVYQAATARWPRSHQKDCDLRNVEPRSHSPSRRARHRGLCARREQGSGRGEADQALVQRNAAGAEPGCDCGLQGGWLEHGAVSGRAGDGAAAGDRQALWTRSGADRVWGGFG